MACESTPHTCRLAKVGWIFTQSAAERDYIMSSEEVQQMAAMQVRESGRRASLTHTPMQTANISLTPPKMESGPHALNTVVQLTFDMLP